MHRRERVRLRDLVAAARTASTWAPSAANVAVAASSPGSGGATLGLPDGRLAIRDDVVHVPVSCSAEVAGELVLLAGSQRIAHKRFTCTPPEKTVRVRLNAAGRKLVADDDRVEARVLVLAAGGTVSRQVQSSSAPAPDDQLASHVQPVDRDPACWLRRLPAEPSR